MDEKEFVKRLKSGDEQAFNEMVEHNSKKIYYLCLKMLQNEKDAEDAAQTTFLKAYTNLSKFEEKSSISTWLHRIAVNVCTDILRKKKKTTNNSLYVTNQDEEEYTVEIPDETESVEDSVIRKEQKEALYRAISELKPKQKKFIILRDIENLSYEEIATMLKLNVGTVKSGINRARKALFEKLKKNSELFS